VLPHLRETGRVTRSYLGVAVVPVSPEVSRSIGLPSPRGAVVAEVVPRSPAAAAGIREGDVIVSLQNAPIQGPSELTRRVGATPPGTEVDLTIGGTGVERTVSVTLVRLADETSRARATADARVRAVPCRRCRMSVERIRDDLTTPEEERI
jgi:serine protease Do